MNPHRKLFLDEEDANKTREDVTNALFDNNFQQLAPRTFVYTDETDTICVYLGESVAIITADGPNVITTWNVIQVMNGEFAWSSILQEILNKF